MPPTTSGRRPAASAPSISARARSAKAPAEKVCVERHERQQPVLQPRLLGGVGGAAEHLEAAVDLQRVGRDRHGILARGPKPLGQRDRDRGLAHAGGPEQGDHVHARSMAAASTR